MESSQFLGRITFSELHEVQGAFGQEGVSPGGAIFYKYLIHSYSLEDKTIVLPLGWDVREACWIPEESRSDLSFYHFEFCGFNSMVRRDLVKKIDFVKVDYDEKEFQPRKDLSIMSVYIPRRSKNRMDKLVQRYQDLKIIISRRSQDSEQIISKKGCKKRSTQRHSYELIIQKSKWVILADEIRKQGLAKDRFSIIVSTGGVFPRQLVNFNSSK